MITQIARVIVDWISKERSFDGEHDELYQFAAYSLLFGMVPFFIVIVLGILFGMLWEGITMLVPYILIRKFSGGYHVKSSSTCFFISLSVLSIALLLTRHIIEGELTDILTIVTLCAVIILYKFSPIDSDARKLSLKERVVFRCVARAIAIGAFIGYLGMLYFEHNIIAVPIGMGINIAALLQLPCLLRIWFRKLHNICKMV